MRLRSLYRAALNRRNLAAPALVLAVALGASASGASAQTGGALASSLVHLANHTAAPCYALGCAGQLAPFNSIVHDLATITSANPSVNPTGTVTFRFFSGTLECDNLAAAVTTMESVAVSAAGGVGVAESSNVGPLADGDYAYKAVYYPDAAAQRMGLRTTPAPCRKLRITKVTAVTEIHLADHTPAPCFASCLGHVAPAGSVLHDLVTVTSDAADRTPTGSVTFAFFAGELHCGGRPSSIETVAVGGSGAVTTGESSSHGPVAAGHYSFKAMYLPDAAAMSRGLGAAAADCEQLLVLEAG